MAILRWKEAESKDKWQTRDDRAHVAQTVVMLVRISCKKAVRVGKAHVDP